MVRAFSLNPSVNARIRNVIPGTSYKPGDQVELVKATKIGSQVKVQNDQRFLDIRHFEFDAEQRSELDQQLEQANIGATFDENHVQPMNA